MDQAVAYSTLALTVTLALSRPRLRPSQLHLTPGTAALLGVLVLLATGGLGARDLRVALGMEWRPLLALACIMTMTGVVEAVGAFDRLAARLERYARRTSAARAFDCVFGLAVLTPSLLNNDSAVLLLTPIAIALGQRLYPREPEMTVAFAFAIFLAPGVAPLVVSNPMNLIVAEYAGIGFGAYARVMGPISIAGALLTWGILRWRFAAVLARTRAELPDRVVPLPHPAERPVVLLLLAVFLAYPIAASLGWPIWIVSLTGAGLSFALARHHGVASSRRLTAHVQPDILLFLACVLLVVMGLRNAGVTAHLAEVYALAPRGSGLQIAIVGVTAAIGSAIVDNHPMSILNMIAIGAQGGDRTLLAALVGGDLGPRLLPLGSLAGLLWMARLRRGGVVISLGRFVREGAMVLAPTLALSLLLLALLG